ncbi:MAG: hypothetical protein M1820_009127, partial [Bogoriella megaspora]
FYELAVDAAGGSLMFRECGKDMIRGLNGDAQAWQPSVRSNLGQLVKDLSAAIDEAWEVRCPTFLGSGALSVLMTALKQGKETDPDTSLIRTWNV